MYTEIWIPGTDTELDKLFERLRIQQHSDISHPLYKNYSSQAFESCAALSITVFWLDNVGRRTPTEY